MSRALVVYGFIVRYEVIAMSRFGRPTYTIKDLNFLYKECALV